MFFFIIKKFQKLFSYLYNNIGLIISALYYPFVIGLLLGPGRWTFSFLASQLGLPGLIYLFAILLIVINLLLRSGLENKSPAISLKAFCIPWFILFSIWIMYYLNFLGINSATNASYLTILLDWVEIFGKMDNFFTPSVINGQMATAGGAGSKEILLEKGLKKLIPSSMSMDGQGNRNILHDTGTGVNNSFQVPEPAVAVLVQESHIVQTKIDTINSELAEIKLNVKATGVTAKEVEFWNVKRKGLLPELRSLKDKLSDLQSEKTWYDNSRQLTQDQFQYGLSLFKIIRKGSEAITPNCSLHLYQLNYTEQEREIIKNVVQKSIDTGQANPLDLSSTDNSNQIRLSKKFIQVIRNEFNNIT